MDNTQLTYFISLVNHLNFSKAAKDCHVVQATISRQIANLEEEIGVALFERDSHNVSLTPAGQILSLYAPVLLEYQRTIMTQVRNAPKGYDESIRIAVGPIEHALIRHPLKAFHLLFPKVGINLTTYTYSILLTRYRNRVTDLCICNEKSAAEMADYKIEELYCEPWEVAASSDSAFWSLPLEEQRLLTGYPIITCVDDRFEPVREYCMEHRFCHSGFFETNFLSTQIELLQSGIGLALLPPFVKECLPPDIRMENILTDSLRTKYMIASNRNCSDKARLFIDLCLNKIGIPAEE